MKRALILACVALVAAGCDNQTQSEGAHVHGMARLAIAMDSPTTAEIELEVPADSLYGFEHEPSSPEQEAAQAEALALLEESPDGLLIAPSELGCRLETLAVEFVAEEHEGEEHEDEDHDDEDHEDEDHEGEDYEGEEHEDEDHEGEDHEGEDHEGEDHEGEDHEGEDHEGEHSEVHARYALTCEQPLAGAELQAAFGDAFPAIEELIVTLLDASGQRSLELEGGSGAIDL